MKDVKNKLHRAGGDVVKLREILSRFYFDAMMSENMRPKVIGNEQLKEMSREVLHEIALKRKKEMEEAERQIRDWAKGNVPKEATNFLNPGWTGWNKCREQMLKNIEEA